MLAWQAWLVEQAGRNGDRAAVAALASVLEGRVLGSSSSSASNGPPELPAGFDAAALMAASREWLLVGGERRTAGAVYTPPAIAAGVLAQATAGWSVPARPRVCDPACGGGAFLVAAARWLHTLGFDPTTIATDLLWGADRDAVAIDAAAHSLRLWALAADGSDVHPPHLVAADPLRLGDAAWPDAGGFDLVIGNPPFQGQLGRGTARTRSESAAVDTRLGLPASGYADTAALFLVLGRRLVANGGRVSLILPESVLAARDASPARAAATAGAALVGLWVAAGPVFEAATKVCAPVVQVGPPPGGGAGERPVRRSCGAGFEPLAAGRVPDRGSWSSLALAAYGTPEVSLEPIAGVLGDLAGATAGFRDQFYGLAPFVIEAAPSAGAVAASGSVAAPLVTSGLIDAGGHRWGQAPTRFAGRCWDRPVVDLDQLAASDPVLARWVRQRLVPKILIATQTKVVEAVADPEAALVPSVPVISVEPFRRKDLWRALAVLLAPPTSAWALAEAGGSALAPDTIKLSATQFRAAPLPAGAAAWAAGADILRAAHKGGGPVAWDRFAATMLDAYGLEADHPVLTWWSARLGRQAPPLPLACR